MTSINEEELKEKLKCWLFILLKLLAYNKLIDMLSISLMVNRKKKTWSKHIKKMKMKSSNHKEIQQQRRKGIKIWNSSENGNTIIKYPYHKESPPMEID